ncbi:MAG: CDP-glycerol glycerophosphotransferase family protein [Oceanococcus sp.]
MSVLSPVWSPKIPIKRWIYRLIGVVDQVLQYIVPARKNQLCYASIPDFSDNAYYLYQYALQHRKGLHHVWLLHDLSMAEQIRSDFQQSLAIHGVRGHSLEIQAWSAWSGYWAFLCSRCAFHTHGMYVFSRRAIKRFRVGLWHGMPIKCIGRLNTVSPNPKPTYSTHYIASSHFFKYVLAAAFGVTAESVLITGQPRCDVLLGGGKSDDQRNRLLGKLELDAARKLVVWLPTYRAEDGERRDGSNSVRSFLDELNSDLLDALQKEAEATSTTILIKLHPYEQADIASRCASWPCISVLSAEQWQARKVQLYDVLSMADGLITDVSSVMIDFAQTGKAIGIFAFDQKRYTRNLVFPFVHAVHDTHAQMLNDQNSISAFFSAIASATELNSPTTSWLNELQQIPASEALLQRFVDPLIVSSSSELRS